MTTRKSGFCALLALLVMLSSGTANAKSVMYNIYVTITSAPHARGDVPASQWDIGSTPVTYSGWFTADDTVDGPISNFHLVIGGRDIASSFSFSDSYFDPSSLQLTFATGDLAAGDSTAPDTLLLFGDFSLTPTPKNPTTNYVAALEPNDQSGTLDTYYEVTQKWAGTMVITPNALPALSTGRLVSVNYCN
jgi:hypothetical protein